MVDSGEYLAEAERNLGVPPSTVRGAVWRIFTRRNFLKCSYTTFVLVFSPLTDFVSGVTHTLICCPSHAAAGVFSWKGVFESFWGENITSG